MARDLKEIYKGSFAKRNAQGVITAYDGGYINYAEASPSASYLQTDGSGGVDYADGSGSYLNSGAPDISNVTGGATTGGNSIEAQAGSPGSNVSMPTMPGGTDSGGVSGALSKALKAMGLGGGDTSNKAALNAAVGLLSAFGQYKENSSKSKLPGMPQLPGMGVAGSGLVGGGGPGLSSQYGPAGGYGYQNYKGATGSTPGMGYAPRTGAPPANSYFTYGSGPEKQFFQQVQPNGGAIAPVTMAAGGSVNGMMPVMPNAAQIMGGGMTPMIGAPSNIQGQALQAGATPMGPRPMMQPPMQMPTQPQAQPQQRPMATAGQGMPQPPAPPQQPPAAPGGALSTMGQRMRAATPRPGMRAMAKGGALSGASGQSRHVQGPGDGTSDSIPARLANGEYVIDAQAVSMLGNGDNAAGAKRLDAFRKSLRSHKGAALAKGKMAPDAKSIDQYMGAT